MTDITYYKNMEPLFGEWRIVRLIGVGSFGKVFEIEREDFGRKYTSAMKVVTIPQNESELRSAMADGMDSRSVEKYYRSVVGEIVDEFALMAELKGTSNIVSYEDHKVLERTDRFGWDILIRMELLTSLSDHIATRGMTRRDIVQLGIDLCKALELCKKQKIIHRDIKPENIFVSKNGDYKLGDFGIAKTVEKTNSAFSQKGTQSYMAPEVFRGEAYGSSVDIYSLGLVLYRLLNNNRAPFLPLYPAPMLPSDREAALKKRLSGAEFPCPVNADEQMYAIIRKASAFQTADRYSSPSEMRIDLEYVLEQQDRVNTVCVGEVFYPTSTSPSAISAAPHPDMRTGDRMAEAAAKTELVLPKNDSQHRNDEHSEVKWTPSEDENEKSEEKNNKKKSEGKRTKKGAVLFAVAGTAVLALAILGVVLFGGGKEPETFASMLWGMYTINDCAFNEYGVPYTDLTRFMEAMQYEDIGGYNVSCVPFLIWGSPGTERRFTQSDWEDLRREFLEENDETYWENYRKTYELNLIDMYFCDKAGQHFRVEGVYEVEGNKLLVCFDHQIDETTYELTLGEWIEYTFSFDGRNLILERNGCRTEMVPYDFSEEWKDWSGFNSGSAYVAADEDAYQSIVGLEWSIYPDRENRYNVYFADGGQAVDPVITFNEDTIAINWLWVRRYYNGRKMDFYEPGFVTTQYIYCDGWGLILIADGECYLYQCSEEQYKES